MTQVAPAQQLIVTQLEQQIVGLPSSTDYLMLMKWRLLSAAQYLLGSAQTEVVQASQIAIETFLSYGPGTSTDKALGELDKAVTENEGRPPSVLPFISSQKRIAVSNALKSIEALGPNVVNRALAALPRARERLAQEKALASVLPGIKYRFELIAAIVEDPLCNESERIKAAAAVLYFQKLDDEIPDVTGFAGVLDDDYALRLTLDAVGRSKQGAQLHWSEKVCSLWYEMPFLVGQNLQRRTNALAISWLDRLNSYVSCAQAFQSKSSMLILLQPAISCSPVHSLMSLLGIIVLDAITSSQNRVQALRIGQTYEIDGKYWVRFGGVSDAPTTPGWLKLHVRANGVVYQPPSLVDRMVPVAERRLSSGQELSARNRMEGPDVLQRFFNWSAPIGQALIGSQLVLVASRDRARQLLDGLQSNGVELLRHGFVRFLETAPTDIEAWGTLIFVVPNLNVARLLLQKGVRVQIVFVDGYDKLERGRHDLPFILNRSKPPSLICWSASGYFPRSDPGWLPAHVCLELGGADLADIVELEGDQAGKLALSQAFNTSILHTQVSPTPDVERGIEAAIDAYRHQISTSSELPEIMRYQLRAGALNLRVLALATPALWQDVRLHASRWSLGVEASWANLRGHVLDGLTDLRAAHMRLSNLVQQLPDGPNSRAVALLRLSQEIDMEGQGLHYVCEDQMQLPLVGAVAQMADRVVIHPTVLKSLPVSKNCVVAGWLGTAFGRKLWAHAPRAVHALVDSDDKARWVGLATSEQSKGGRQSVIEFAKGVAAKPAPANVNIVTTTDGQKDDESSKWRAVASTPCAFLWLVGESQAKIVPRDARLFVQQGELIREREAVRLSPNDRVILGAGNGRWSPTDEFTDVLVEAVEASHPEIVKVAKEWRRAIHKFRDARGLTTSQLRSVLGNAGVAREAQTLDGWLELDRASPIAPRGVKTLQLLAPLVADHSDYGFANIAEACRRLKKLRLTAGRALLMAWKGGAPVTGEIGDDWIEGLLDRLRREVQVYEVEAVTLGDVPTSMLGWWLPTEIIGRFEVRLAESA
jgi:hypothetical protein